MARDSALAFRTRAPESPRPSGLAIADVASTLAGGAAVVHDVQGLLPWSSGDAADAVGDMVASPDGSFLVVALTSARGTMQHIASLDVTKWLADPSVVPVRLGPSTPDYALRLASGGARFWLEAGHQFSASSQHTGSVSYRWDGSDPIWLSDRWPDFKHVATCGAYAITDLTDVQLPLQLLQVTSPSSLMLQSITGAHDALFWDGFSKDCRVARRSRCASVSQIGLSTLRLCAVEAPTARSGTSRSPLDLDHAGDCKGTSSSPRSMRPGPTRSTVPRWHELCVPISSWTLTASTSGYQPWSSPWR